jgi:hypothetical protein
VTSVTSITYAKSGRNLVVTVTVVDSTGKAVSGAKVAATIKRGTSTTTVSGTTASTGKVSFTITRAASGAYTTTITGVTLTGTTWDGKTPANTFTF